jgi:hypothetical protein
LVLKAPAGLLDSRIASFAGEGFIACSKKMGTADHTEFPGTVRFYPRKLARKPNIPLGFFAQDRPSRRNARRYLKGSVV